MIGSQVRATSVEETDDYLKISNRRWREGRDAEHIDERVESAVTVTPMNDAFDVNRRIMLTIRCLHEGDDSIAARQESIIIPDSMAVRIAEYILSQERPEPAVRNTDV